MNRNIFLIITFVFIYIYILESILSPGDVWNITLGKLASYG